ncbi:hypothetical protein Dimus_008085, partial [Dionaea muscipula]
KVMGDCCRRRKRWLEAVWARCWREGCFLAGDGVGVLPGIRRTGGDGGRDGLLLVVVSERRRGRVWLSWCRVKVWAAVQGLG